MRFGMTAAAAAALLCAGQADAARYFQFELRGTTEIPASYAPNSGNTSYNTTILVTLDALTADNGFVYARNGTANIAFDIPHGQLYNRESYASTDVPTFSVNFSVPAVATSETLQPIAYSGFFKYVPCTFAFCRTDGIGSILSFTARTSDIAPAFLGVTVTTTATAVPEPAAWAMMIAGFGLAGVAMRRRKSLTQRRLTA